MKTNLSSQITLNRVSPRYYRPENAFERSVLTRLEKIPTDIYESAEEGANQIALDIVSKDKNRYFLEKMYSFFWVFSLNTLKKRIWCILYNVSFVWGISEDNHIKIDHSSHFLSFGFVIFVCVYKL